MSKLPKIFYGTAFLLSVFFGMVSCLDPLYFDPNINGDFTGTINTKDVTEAVLLLTNISKTIDVTKVTITQEENPGQDPLAESNISFENKPKRLSKKAQYLIPSDKDYTIVIDYNYFLYSDPDTLEGTGTQTLVLPLPLPRAITEVFIYRDKEGSVIMDINKDKDPDLNDTSIAADDAMVGEGSSPAVIPPESRNKMASFVVVSKTRSQTIDSVYFKMGNSGYSIGRIDAHDKQSIALGQGSWETRLKYTRDGIEHNLGPLNSIVVPSGDPQAIKEHYLYFYLNTRGHYAISQDWPPNPNDAEDEDLLPPDNGSGRGLLKIINNNFAMVKMVTIHNLRDTSLYPLTYMYQSFTPQVPIQFNRIGFVDVIGTKDFPLQPHEGYLIQVSVETNNGQAVMERMAYLKDQVVTIIIPSDITFMTDDPHEANSKGVKVSLLNNTSTCPVEIVGLIVRNSVNRSQSSYFDKSTWEPKSVISKNESAIQYVMSTTGMPIVLGARFEALIAIQGNGKTALITKIFSPATLYSDSSPELNTRTLVITDADVPESLKDPAINEKGTKLTLENTVSTWPVQIIGLTVRNIAAPGQSSFYGPSTWEPQSLIDKGGSAVQYVMNSASMPITAGAEFEALIAIQGNGKTAIVTKTFSPAELYSVNSPDLNPRTLTITDADVPDELKTPVVIPDPNPIGARVTLQNNTNTYPVKIISMTVQNKTTPAESSIFGPSTWEPQSLIDKGGSAIQDVLSTASMPITPTDEFEALIVIYGNGKTAIVTKSFSPAELYSVNPELNTRTLAITDVDVPESLKDLVIPEEKPNIKGAKIGDTIIIDGIEWIKVKVDSYYPDLALLLLKGVIPGDPVKYHHIQYNGNYAASDIRGFVDTWYASLASPTLKKIAWLSNQSTIVANPSWPGTSLAGPTNYSQVAFIPGIMDIVHLMKANGYNYWLTDVYLKDTSQGYVTDSIGIIKANGDSNVHVPADNYGIYARPVIWVTMN